MKIGMIGIGRMGAYMAQRLVRAGHEVVGYARTKATVDGRLQEGAITSGATSLEDVVSQLPSPRIIWMMVPAASVDDTINQFSHLLQKGDIIVDGGNSYYRDDIRRAASLEKLGIHYVDSGTSGGVWGLERGYCQMIGGETEIVQYLDPIFSTLAPGVEAALRTPERKDKSLTSADKGYLHCGPHGAGHFVKMVHNGIEYGIMAAYGEGLNILKHANIGKTQATVDAETAPVQDAQYYQYDLDIPEITELWRRGSVIGSWLLDLTASALQKSPELQEFAGRVSDSGEGRWTISSAIDEGVPAPVLSNALFSRFASRNEDEYANKILSAMRFEFGGHHEKTDK